MAPTKEVADNSFKPAQDMILAVDPYGLGELVEQLSNIGITQENNLLIGVAQGWKMKSSIVTCERRIVNGTLKHDGCEMASWCVGNLKIEPTATSFRASKQNLGDAKIDPIMALFDAATVMSTNPVPTAGLADKNKQGFFEGLGS